MKTEKIEFSSKFATIDRREFFINSSRKIVISVEGIAGKQWLQARIWGKDQLGNWFGYPNKGIMIPQENAEETLAMLNQVALEAGFINHPDNSTQQSANINPNVA